jgi:hypothetical protein
MLLCYVGTDDVLMKYTTPTFVLDTKAVFPLKHLYPPNRLET